MITVTAETQINSRDLFIVHVQKHTCVYTASAVLLLLIITLSNTEARADFAAASTTET